MEFKDKYTTKVEVDKTTVSNDAYCIGDMIDNLIKALERLPR